MKAKIFLLLISLVVLLLCSIKCKSQSRWDEIAHEAQKTTDSLLSEEIEILQRIEFMDSIHSEIIQIFELSLKGYKAIRHDALITCRFRYAYYMKKQIRNQEEAIVLLKEQFIRN